MSRSRTPQGYADPYLAGVGLGLVLLLALTWVGRGLGASGAFASSAAGVVAAVAPSEAAASPLFAHYLSNPGPWLEWLNFELIGVLCGAALSAALAGRWRIEIERGPAQTAAPRLAAAFAGGLLMAAGAVLARGCTSGQALTGGALLGVGGWLFLALAFASAYAFAPLLRRSWL